MEFENMNMEEVVQAMEEQRSRIDTAPDSELDEIKSNLDRLDARKKELEKSAERREQLRARVQQSGTTVRTFHEQTQERREYNDTSPEYRNAFLKNLLGRELSTEERAAFVHTTQNTPNVLPRTMLNNIWSMIEEQHSIMQDITIYRTGTILELVKHTAIVQGDAKVVDEAAANDDEQNTFVKVTLTGKDYSKHVDISYRMAKMSIDSLETYLVNEIAERIGAAMARDVISKIISSMDSGNKTTPTGFDYADAVDLFALPKRANNVTVYGRRETVFKHLVGMVDTAGRPIFQGTAQEGARGTLLGAAIKFEDAVPANVLLIGDPKRFVFNMVQDIMLETDRDIKTHVITHSGYACGEGELVDTGSFAMATITP